MSVPRCRSVSSVGNRCELPAPAESETHLHNCGPWFWVDDTNSPGEGVTLPAFEGGGLPERNPDGTYGPLHVGTTVPGRVLP